MGNHIDPLPRQHRREQLAHLVRWHDYTIILDLHVDEPGSSSQPSCNRASSLIRAGSGARGVNHPAFLRRHVVHRHHRWQAGTAQRLGIQYLHYEQAEDEVQDIG